jgi:hypothetical protein
MRGETPIFFMFIVFQVGHNLLLAPHDRAALLGGFDRMSLTRIND